MKHKKIFIICVVLTLIIAGSFWIKNNHTGGGNLASSGVNFDGEICPADHAKSIEQFGITWYFQDCERYGTFANGDYWIVGPVTITKITPESIAIDLTPASTTDSVFWVKNGTMVNPMPGNAQGYDSTASGNGYSVWNADLNKAPSFTKSNLQVTTGSVVSTISISQIGNNGTRPQLTDGSVLTVLSSIPPEGSFRPSIVGTDKTVRWNKSQLKYNILKSYAPVENTPALSTVESYFERPWFVQADFSAGRYIAPLNNMPEYGRDQAQRLSLGLLSLHLNYSNTQKEKLYISLVQYGIDIYGSVKNGMFFEGQGALNAGRKAPMVLAGLALNDADIKDWSDANKHFIFQEDRQTFYVSERDVNLGRTDNNNSVPGKIAPPGQIGCTAYRGDGSCERPLYPYTTSMIGTPEWGEAQSEQPSRSGSQWDTYYRWAGASWHGNILALILTEGGKSAWNWPAVFDYADRYWSIEGVRGFSNQTYEGSNGISPFVFSMWEAYRVGGTYTPPDPSTYIVTLSVSKSGNGTGTIVSNDSNINCGSTCSKAYTIADNKQVTLTAVPATNSQFTSWSGDCTGINPICTLTMNDNKNTTATFTAIPAGRVCKPWN